MQLGRQKLDVKRYNTTLGHFLRTNKGVSIRHWVSFFCVLDIMSRAGKMGCEGLASTPRELHSGEGGGVCGLGEGPRALRARPWEDEGADGAKKT